MNRMVFIDSNYETEMDKNGFVLFRNFLSTQTITRLLEIFDKIDKVFPVEDPFYTTNWVNETYRTTVHEQLAKVVLNDLSSLFLGYKNILNYYLVKRSSEINEVTPHRDWSLVDEKIYTGVTAWMPLSDTNEENGCFQILRNSHKSGLTLRGSNIKCEYPDSKDLELENINMSSGDLLIFDHRLLHASPANRSPQTRIAVASVFIPEETSPVHYMLSEEEQMYYKLSMSDDFLIQSSLDKQSQQFTLHEILKKELIEKSDIPAKQSI